MEKHFFDWFEQRDLGADAPILNETASSNRYSVEINFRTTLDEITDAAAKLMLGYVSAGLKNCQYHVKVIFSSKPFRVIVSTRNWDDGEWVGIVTWHDHERCFVIAKGSFNKDRKTVSVHSSKKCSGKSAAEVVKELRNYMEKLKHEKPRGSSTLEPAQLKRGPKPTHMKKLKKISGPWKPRHPN